MVESGRWVLRNGVGGWLVRGRLEGLEFRVYILSCITIHLHLLVCLHPHYTTLVSFSLSSKSAL
jgi:hypothetical protein